MSGTTVYHQRAVTILQHWICAPQACPRTCLSSCGTAQDRKGQSPPKSPHQYPQRRFGQSSERPDVGQHLQDADPQVPLWRSDLQPLLQICHTFWSVCKPARCPHFRHYYVTQTGQRPTLGLFCYFLPHSQRNTACWLSQLLEDLRHDAENPIRMVVCQYDRHQQDCGHVQHQARHANLYCKYVWRLTSTWS